MKDSPCYGCNVGFYCDYEPKWCKDSAVKQLGQDEMYEPSDCENWRCGQVVADQENKVA